jgi:hypothetical protein
MLFIQCLMFVEACGIPHDTFLACDQKKACQKKLLATPDHCIGHYFGSLDDAIRREGPCILHPTESSCKVTRKSADATVGGMSCHAFSTARGNITDVPPHMHPDYKVVHDDFFDYTDEAQQKGGIAEEVLGWDKPCPENQKKREKCNKPGIITYKDMWLHKLCKRGYAYASITLDNETWYETPKKR